MFEVVKDEILGVGFDDSKLRINTLINGADV